MISEKLTKALNEQVNAEYYSAYLYQSMSSCMERAALKGAANWLFVQAKEEMAHGINIYQYILDRGAVPVLSAVAQPDESFSDIEEIFKAVLEHEQKVTGLINAIASLAMQESDHACYQFIMWYVNEQVEEEATASDILSRVQMIGEDKGLLLSLDNELGARVFVNPFQNNSKLGGV